MRHPPKFSNGSISRFILFLKVIALGIVQELQGLSFATLILFCDVSVKENQKFRTAHKMVYDQNAVIWENLAHILMQNSL